MKIDASKSLFLHLAFDGPMLARPFGKWLAEVPLANEDESHEMFVLEPMSLDETMDHDFQDIEPNATVQTLIDYLTDHCLGPHYRFPGCRRGSP